MSLDTNAVALSRHLRERVGASNAVMAAVSALSGLTRTPDARIGQPGWAFQRTIPVTLEDGTVALAEVRVRYRHPRGAR